MEFETFLEPAGENEEWRVLYQKIFVSVLNRKFAELFKIQSILKPQIMLSTCDIQICK
jgi:hypothetical protein